MHILAIDVGSYSIKYITSFVDKRRINHSEMSEILLSDYLSSRPELDVLQGQINIVHEIIDSNARPDTKIIFQADNEMMTTRFLTLPVKSKKNAERMLPFQLEEDIPYTLGEIHYAYRMEPQKTQHFALVELVREDIFEGYYNLLKEKDSLPNILTSEASVVENFFNLNPIAGPFCVLDIGHKVTKAYFFYNSRLIVTHVSYMAGNDINEMIAQTYKIDHEEAVQYKHQNAFLLTAAQYDEVEPSQRDFAVAMDKVFSPLITDFTRWRIGFKVNYGLNLGNVYLCGGSSNIKNIANYLTEKWDTKVALLESFDKVEGVKVDLSSKNKTKFSLANMMAVGFRRKNRFINLLSGRFMQASTSEVPLNSFAFLAVRVATVSLIVVISLLVERFFIQKDAKTLNGRIASIMKNDELQINGRLRRAIADNPRPVLDSLVKRQRGVRQEISTLQAALEIQALSPLVTVSQIAANSEAILTEFVSNDMGEIVAIFTAEKIETLTQLKTAFEVSNLGEVTAVIDEKNLQLKITATGN